MRSTGDAAELRGRRASGGEAGTETERLARHAGHDLEWVRTSWWRNAWELRAGDAVLLRMSAQDWWRSRLEASLDGERIVFGRPLLRAAALRARDGAEVARLHRTPWRLDEDSRRLGMSALWGTGRLDVAGARAWLRRDPWSSRWTLLDEREREMAAFTCRYFGLFVRGEMRVTARLAEHPAPALLATFAWWVVARDRQRQSHAH